MASNPQAVTAEEQAEEQAEAQAEALEWASGYAAGKEVSSKSFLFLANVIVALSAEVEQLRSRRWSGSGMSYDSGARTYASGSMREWPATPRSTGPTQE